MAERTMLDIQVDDAVEPHVVAADQEYRLRIVGGHVTKSDKGTFLIIRFEVKDDPYSKEFTSVYSTDFENMSPKQANDAKWRLAQLFKACKFNYRGGALDPDEDLKGLECTAILGVKSSDDFGDQNTLKKLIIPR